MKVPYVHHTHHGPRQTARAIVIRDGQILLMERWRDGHHYFAIPGGGIDAGESAEVAAVREIKEETSISIKVDRLVYEMLDKDGGHTHYFYLCEYINGEPHLPAGSEEAKQGSQNRFKPRWMPISQLTSLTFYYWEPIRSWLIHDCEHGFDKKVKITAV